MRKLLFKLISFIIILFINCAAFFGTPTFLDYNIHLKSVDRPANTKKQYGDFQSIKLQEYNKYIYSDDLIDATFFASRVIYFTIRNKSDHTMKLIWDDAAFIEPDNTTTRVMHAGVKYIDRNNSLPPSIIPRHGIIDDQAIPVDRVYWRDGYYSSSLTIAGGWENAGLFPCYSLSKDPDSFLETNKKYIGSNFGLLLSFQIEGIANEYTFWFEVKDVKIATRDSLLTESEVSIKITKIQDEYILFESATNYKIGDRFNIKRESENIGKIEVVKIQGQKIAGKIISGKDKIKIGDRIETQHKKTVPAKSYNSTTNY